MFTIARRLLLLSLLLCPAGVSWAEPVTLRLSFFTSDRSNIYQCQIRPFVEAVNAEGAGIVEIKILFSGKGAVSTEITEQPLLVRDGDVDLAFVVPGLSPQIFPDTAVLQMPGLYRTAREASLVFTRLVESGALTGYQPYFVVGAYVSASESVHSRKPIATLAELAGRTIRVNNAIEAMTLRLLGANPVVVPINRTMDKLSDGTLDAVSVPPWMLFEFGFGRLTEGHFLIGLGGAPVALIMNRAKFAGLPGPAQEIIRKYSGDWLAEREAACAAAKNQEVLDQLHANARHKVVEPTASDQAALRSVYAFVTQAWAAQSSHNQELLAAATEELAKLRKDTPR
jgi:TRAP-type C4-dicarboxylate transport system substrate-binding protein